MSEQLLLIAHNPGSGSHALTQRAIVIVQAYVEQYHNDMLYHIFMVE